MYKDFKKRESNFLSRSLNLPLAEVNEKIKSNNVASLFKTVKDFEILKPEHIRSGLLPTLNYFDFLNNEIIELQKVFQIRKNNFDNQKSILEIQKNRLLDKLKAIRLYKSIDTQELTLNLNDTSKWKNEVEKNQKKIYNASNLNGGLFPIDDIFPVRINKIEVTAKSNGKVGDPHNINKSISYPNIDNAFDNNKDTFFEYTRLDREVVFDVKLFSEEEIFNSIKIDIIQYGLEGKVSLFVYDDNDELLLNEEQLVNSRQYFFSCVKSNFLRVKLISSVSESIEVKKGYFKTRSILGIKNIELFKASFSNSGFLYSKGLNLPNKKVSLSDIEIGKANSNLFNIEVAVKENSGWKTLSDFEGFSEFADTDELLEVRLKIEKNDSFSNEENSLVNKSKRISYRKEVKTLNNPIRIEKPAGEFCLQENLNLFINKYFQYPGKRIPMPFTLPENIQVIENNEYKSFSIEEENGINYLVHQAENPFIKIGMENSLVKFDDFYLINSDILPAISSDNSVLAIKLENEEYELKSGLNSLKIEGLRDLKILNNNNQQFLDYTVENDRVVLDEAQSEDLTIFANVIKKEKLEPVISLSNGNISFKIPKDKLKDYKVKEYFNEVRVNNFRKDKKVQINKSKEKTIEAGQSAFFLSYNYIVSDIFISDKSFNQVSFINGKDEFKYGSFLYYEFDRPVFENGIFKYKLPSNGILEQVEDLIPMNPELLNEVNSKSDLISLEDYFIDSNFLYSKSKVLLKLGMFLKQSESYEKRYSIDYKNKIIYFSEPPSESLYVEYSVAPFEFSYEVASSINYEKEKEFIRIEEKNINNNIFYVIFEEDAEITSNIQELKNFFSPVIKSIRLALA